jgi:hypothetical protein
MRSFPGEIRILGLLFATLLLFVGSGCADRDLAEEHVKLFLRIEHLPPGRTQADEEVVLRAVIESSLDGSKLEAWVRIVGEGDTDERIRLQIAEGGVGSATVPGRPRGEVIQYVIEARDAAGLVVALPQGADEGKTYSLRFVGESSRILGAISFLSAVLAVVLFIGAGAAAVQNLRGRMSAGPAGMLGGFGVILVVVGLLLIGAIHARQVTGHFWPDTPVLLALSRGDLALVSLVWIGNLFVGRRLLLDEEPEGAPRGERAFAGIAALLAVVSIIALLF